MSFLELFVSVLEIFVGYPGAIWCL